MAMLTDDVESRLNVVFKHPHYAELHWVSFLSGFTEGSFCDLFLGDIHPLFVVKRAMAVMPSMAQVIVATTGAFTLLRTDAPIVGAAGGVTHLADSVRV